jgi:hypothetical protein
MHVRTYVIREDSKQYYKYVSVNYPDNVELRLTHAQAVLAVGNALNGSSFRGGAHGFQLEALMKAC